jgi:hypothetical protein
LTHTISTPGTEGHPPGLPRHFGQRNRAFSCAAAPCCRGGAGDGCSEVRQCISYEEEDTCISYEEEVRQCMSCEEENTCMSYEEEDACMSYEEEDTCSEVRQCMGSLLLLY